MTRESQRAQECSYRRPKSCGRIDLHLGWVDGIPMDTCDSCWKCGPNSPEANKVRMQYADRVIGVVKVKGVEHYAPIVQASIMGRHMTPDEAEQAAHRIACHKTLQAVRAKNSLWDGVPYPKRLYQAVGAAGRAFKGKLKSYKGCGCFKPLKKLVTGK